VIDPTQLKLGITVVARGAIYVLVVSIGLVYRPAFLLVNLDAKEGNGGFGRGVIAGKLVHVLAPEKFVTLAVFRERGLIMNLEFFIIQVLDMCGVAALVIGAKHGDLPAALAVGYPATIVSFVTFFVIFIDYN
jgi:hypothetical protein